MIVAQITDFHVTAFGRRAYRGVDTAACLTLAVAQLAALDPAPDCVVATGDLTESGRPEEYEFLRDLLAPLNAPLYLIPGNHDDREALRRAFADKPYIPALGFLDYVIDAHAVRLVALDTLVPGRSGGRIERERLEWLDRTLAEARHRPTAIIMHHPPFRTGITHMDAIGLDGAEAFAAVLARHPQVQRVLCGHLHRAIQTVLAPGAIASTAPSTAHQARLDLRPDGPADYILEPPGYQLHLWDESGACVTHTGYIGKFEGPYPFREERRDA